MIVSFRKYSSSSGSTVCVPNSRAPMDMVLMALRKLVMGAFEVHSARLHADVRWAGLEGSHTLYFLGLTPGTPGFVVANLFAYSDLFFDGLLNLCMFLILITFSLRKSLFGGGWD